jgi:hypothetical protein
VDQCARRRQQGFEQTIATYPVAVRITHMAGRCLTFPVVVPNTVVAVCGQRLSGSQDIFEMSGNVTCLS